MIPFMCLDAATDNLQARLQLAPISLERYEEDALRIVN